MRTLLYFFPVLLHMIIATAIASGELHSAYQPTVGLAAPLRVALLFLRVIPSALLSAAMLPHQTCAWVEGLCSLDAEFETTPKNGSSAVPPPCGGTAASLPVSQLVPVQSLAAEPARLHATAPPTSQPAPRPVQRARVHWYVYAELAFVAYQLCWVIHFLRCGQSAAAWGVGCPALAVGTLCCFYGDQATSIATSPLPPRDCATERDLCD